MNINKNFSLMLILIVSLLSVSCKKATIPNHYLGVKSTENSDWEIICTKTGELVEGAKYKNPPSPIYHRLYCVQAEDSLFYYYHISDPKTPLNKEGYVDAGPFDINGYAFAVKDGGAIQMLDIDMNVVKVLDKTIRVASHFSNGYAAVQNDQGKWGFVDIKGNIVIPMVYDEVKNFTTGDDFTIGNKTDSKGDITFYVIDKNGNERCSVKGLIGMNAGRFSEGYFIVRDNEGKYYSYNEDGKKIKYLGTLGSNPEKYIEDVRFRNGDVIFFDNNKAGLKDYKGRVTLKPEYSSLYGCRLGKKYYIASKDKTLSGVIDRNNVVKIPFEFNVLEALNHQRLIGVKNNVGRIIDLDGNPVGNYTFNKASTEYAKVESDYFNPTFEAKKLLDHIGPENILQVNNQMAIGDIRQTIYDSRIVHEDSVSYTYQQDRFRKFFVRTSRPYRLKNGKNDFKAPISNISYTYEISKFPNAATKMREYFEAGLAVKGYSKVGDHKFKKLSSPTILTTEVNDGNFTLSVNFSRN